MSAGCADLDRALLEDDAAALETARSHASSCPSCAERLEAWEQLSVVARAMRRSWDSPGLWPRIEAALAREVASRPPGERGRRARRALLAVAATVAIAAGAWLLMGPLPSGTTPEALQRRLLTERALAEVERSETEYVASIDRLAALAEPLLREPQTKALLLYREKLQVLDEAIVECRSRIEANRFNARLRDELLSVYREKQRTLRGLIEEERHAL